MICFLFASGLARAETTGQVLSAQLVPADLPVCAYSRLDSRGGQVFAECLRIAAQAHDAPWPESPDDLSWQKLESEYLNRGFIRDRYWLVARFRYTGEVPQSTYLEVGYGLLDDLVYTLREGNQVIAKGRFGDRQPFSERLVQYPNFAIPLQVRPGAEYTVLMTVKTTSSMQVPLILWGSDQFVGAKYTESMIMGLLIGMILIMVAYNTFLYFALRDIAYLYFAICLLGYAAVEGILSATAFAYLWPDSLFWNDRALVFSANLALGALGLFSIRFLALEEAAPRFARWLKLEVVLCSIFLLAAFLLPYRVMIVITAINVVLVPVTAYVASLMLYSTRDKAASFFVLAFTSFVVSATIFVLSKFGWLPRSFFTEHTIHFGAVSVVALLSFALADRVNRERSDKEIAQQNSIVSLDKYRLLYENALEGMFRINLAGELLSANPAFVRLMGAIDERALMAQATSLINRVPAEDSARRNLYREMKRQGHVFGYEARCRRLDGSEFWAAIFARILSDNESGETVIEGSLVDVTDRKRSEERLNYLATHDSLTGLINRSEMENRLKRALAQSREGRTQHAFVFIDLDQFKVVNDTCGHRAGDNLLKQLSAVFKRHLRSRDALARLGGDEFGILLEHCDLSQAQVIAESIRQDVSEFRFNWNNKVFRVGTSIGVVAIRPDFESIDQITSMADIACYAAKEQGRDRVIVHRENQDELSQRRTEMELVSTVKEAARDGLFELYFQKILPCRESVRQEGDRIEILLRLRQDGVIVPPGRFLPVAERYNFIAEIDCWVVENTLKWLRESPERMAGIQQVNINLSGQTIGNRSAAKRIVTMLDKAPLPTVRLCFEITEHSAIANLQDTAQFIKGLRGKGVHFSLDDFGSGFSSYNHLKHLPVSSLKVDGAFVRDIATDRFDLAMVKSIAEIAHAMGLSVVAEFVEDQSTLDALTKLDVDHVQGYYLHRPEPLTQYTPSRL